jgi:hypothetical protein
MPSGSTTPPFSYITWVSSGFDVGPDTSLEGTSYATIVTNGVPILLENDAPNPNPLEKTNGLSSITTNARIQTTSLGDLAKLATVRDVNGSIIVPNPLTYIQLGKGHEMSFDEDTLSGRVTPALSNKLLNEFDVALAGGQQTFTGSDLRVMIEIPTSSTVGDAKPRYAKQLLECTTFTVSVHRSKAPVSAAGYIGPKGFARGRRTIAGTLVLTQFTVEVLMRFLQSTLLVDRSKDTHFMKVDQLPAFNMTLLFTNELGYASFRRLLGVEFITDGVIYSIQDMLTEQTISYMASDFTPLIPLTLSSLYHPVDQLDRQTRREKSASDLNNVQVPKKTI